MRDAVLIVVAAAFVFGLAGCLMTADANVSGGLSPDMGQPRIQSTVQSSAQDEKKTGLLHEVEETGL